ncbi:MULTISPECIES: hypothetical protein [unclassified Streptomyces]|uniref:hypothetical protein n=1 Tax=unclassified Streptomyces TaxID=2593676 RepID=UPI000DB98813|nr:MULTISPECIES: hypothetical protein [unclassified Streptomyces]MYT68309.1 hypothetical protein [Streptomyces sp. SID8367]RAJ76944.1 hypothetical protein K377_06113 [Streptomyces sp. PsTaAH-137]
MLIEEYVVDIRRQMTRESLRTARIHLAGLPDWSALVPAAKNADQERLESLLLHVFGLALGRHPLGVSEIVPQADRLLLRMERTELVVLLLSLLPYRDRRRSRHGVLDLRAVAIRRGIELTLGRFSAGRAVIEGPAGCDPAGVLDAHRVAIEERGYEPLWDEVTPRDPVPNLLRRPTRARKRTTPADPHTVRPGLASALLRRLHLWPSLTAGSTVTFTSRPDGGGLAWEVQRRVPPHLPLHEDSVATALSESVAGPGLSSDETGHHCDQQQCIQTFADGRLTVRTTHGEQHGPARRPGRDRAHIWSTFLSEAQPSAQATGQARPGHVLQLIDPWGDAPGEAAEHLAAAWAQQGLRTLVLNACSDHTRRGETASWQRARLTGGSGAMFTGVADYVYGDLKADLERARSEFDEIILLKQPWTTTSFLGLSSRADDHVVVASGGFERNSKRTTVHAGQLRRRTTPFTPNESAVAWLNSSLIRVPYAELPLTGLVLWCTPEVRELDTFETEVVQELARHGMPVLGRLPKAPRLGSCRTVLDRLPGQQEGFVLQQAAQIRTSFGTAHGKETLFETALREYARG